jgi:hypothetical protein
MTDMAAHSVDHVIPRVPVRQWVLSLPHALRYRLAYDHARMVAVFGLFVRAVLGFYKRKAKARGLRMSCADLGSRLQARPRQRDRAQLDRAARARPTPGQRAGQLVDLPACVCPMHLAVTKGTKMSNQDILERMAAL